MTFPSQLASEFTAQSTDTTAPLLNNDSCDTQGWIASDYTFTLTGKEYKSTFAKSGEQEITLTNNWFGSDVKFKISIKKTECVIRFPTGWQFKGSQADCDVVCYITDLIFVGVDKENGIVQQLDYQLKDGSEEPSTSLSAKLLRKKAVTLEDPNAILDDYGDRHTLTFTKLKIFLNDNKDSLSIKLTIRCNPE